MTRGGEYVGITFEEALDPATVEFSDDVVLVPAELAGQLKQARPTPDTPVPTAHPVREVSPEGREGVQPPIFTGRKVASVRWAGEIPHQKWTTFYTKVLQRLVSEGGLRLRVEFEARPPGGLHVERAEEPDRVSATWASPTASSPKRNRTRARSEARGLGGSGHWGPSHREGHGALRRRGPPQGEQQDDPGGALVE